MPDPAYKRPLIGKTTLVTGATSGIGLACAERFSELGAKVILASRRADCLDDIVRRMSEAALPLVVDVSNEASVATAISTAWDAVHGIDYLVHAAGVATPAALEDLTSDIWRRHIDTNLSGAFYVMRECALRMRKRGSGSIVAIASDLSFKGMPAFSHYCASKAGLVGFAKALALELAPHVRVNCVCPGPVDTPMLQAELEMLGESAELRAEVISKVPLKRIASPNEIANFVTFIATEASFATGSILSIDGGTTAG